MTHWITLIKFFSLTYYIPPALLIICLATVFIGYFNKRKFKSLKFLPIYAIASFLQIIITFICISYRTSPFSVKVNNYTIFLFVIIEFVIFYNLTLQWIKSSYLKKSIYFIGSLFIAFSIYSLFNIDFSENIPDSFYITDSICLVIPCLVYFYEIFTTSPLISLSSQPSFWIIIGFSFMAICTLPFYLLEPYLYENIVNFYDQVYTLNYIFYCLLFIFISKAFLCRPVTAK